MDEVGGNNLPSAALLTTKLEEESEQTRNFPQLEPENEISQMLNQVSELT